MDDPLAHFDSAYPDLVTVDKGAATDDGARSPDDAGALTDVDASSTCSVGRSAPFEASEKSVGSTRKRKKVYKPGYNSNKARDERKEALLLLRKQVSELQALRDELQRRQSGCKAVEALPAQQQALWMPLSHKCPQSRTAGASGVVWKDVAATQFKERQRAEMENIRLRRALEGQLKVARSLEKVLSKRHSDRALESICDQHDPTLLRNQTVDPDTDASIFRELLAGVANALGDVDQDLAANGLMRMVRNHHDALVHRDGRDISLEIYATKVMPFDVESAGEAVWDHYSDSMDRLPFRTVVGKQRQNVLTAADTIVESFGLRLESSRKTTATMRVRRVLRKFVEPDRVVIAWRALSESVEVATERLDGARMVERGFTVVRKAPDSVDTHSLVQTCYIVHPELLPDSTDELELSRKMTAVSDFLVDSVTRMISASHQAVENVLIDQALLGSSGVEGSTQAGNSCWRTN